jgi:hypothetical protein
VFAKIGHVLIKIVSTSAASERPLYLQKQTSLNATDMSAMCQNQTNGAAACRMQFAAGDVRQTRRC